MNSFSQKIFGMARTKELAQIPSLSMAILLAEVVEWERDYGKPDYIAAYLC